ncbi:DDE-type integrase/transposase/recombinase [Pectobacterium aroidearum]|uniref:DDE-type integrase/transposase/recombinase n=1 Tax=Pectobacterium aroidearum TaxID=1201031 RepID=UPI002115B5F9|nr:DDE-type integrase/transposase/recombinase [Pectobacterium aroidearum]UUE71116.1 DDE-type integrase/transposase/recombinase [Pectobacterium aroidearum]UUE71496.1 DDE-type integrase/transposase/recombinase [Pectobacterium aroidearum]UUE71564.1 DDE-type integrase/transposase/recombinase [Pectobacterium aroidearum]UUE75514.1 DDE-type integrase/transposase/recombinase [Pectobacterium aroidearum]UUE75898.1 DDE-type integrase/transposase/recombinase [Pectobacterium aroidearum]
MSGALTERLVAIAQAARNAAHGGRGAIYDTACAELGLSRATLLRKLKEVSVPATRKRRNDAGKSALTRDDALMISALLTESTRKNGKRLYSVADAVTELRANNMITAEFTDTATGEVRPLSESTVIRAMRTYGVHPDQLMAPEPSTRLASLHPNHVWLIDASLCTLYYLQNGKKTTGLQVMSNDEFYKNKPKNLARIVNDRVWSYEITDHTSGWIYVEYVLGAESGENLCSVLINAMQERGGADVLHGVPEILFMDPGSANTAAMTRNMCKSLGIEIIAHKAGNARATGQVEKARDIIERKFEPGLKFVEVNSLDELNAMAKRWRSYFNATAIHSRHGQTRNDIWLRITAEQLIKAPSVDVCRELAIAAPERRKVQPTLEISFQGRKYDVSTVPGVMINESVMVTRNPWRTDAAQIVLTGEDGREVFHLVEEVPENEFGFSTNAAIIGESYKKPADTVTQHVNQQIEQLVTGTDSAEAAAAARKAKAVPFGGQFDPYRTIDDSTLPTYLPKRGTASDVRGPRIDQRPLTHVEAAKQLRSRLTANGHNWTAQHYQQLVAQYPDGVPADEIENVVESLTAAPATANVVGIR